MKDLIKPKTVFSLIFLFSLIGFFAHTYYTKSAIFADGKFYYSITRSLIKDADIDFENEYEHFGIGVSRTKTGYVWNMYPPGTSFFWIPGFVLADDAVSFVELLPWVKLDTRGYSLIYQSSVAISSIILGLLGLFLVFLTLKRYFSKKVSLLTVIALFATTNLLFYISVEQINSHAVSFFVSALFVYFFIIHRPSGERAQLSTKKYYFILGLLGGVAGLVRTQDSLILLIPILQLILSYKNIKHKILYTICLSSGSILAFIPQLYFWYKIFGTIGSPYSGFGFNLLSPKTLHVLFNTTNGLFLITPLILLAVMGLILIVLDNKSKKLKRIAVYGLIYFILQLYIISSWNFYFQGGSYSIRMMITTYPLLAFGLAKIILEIIKRYKLKYALFLILTFAVINTLSIIRYLLLY